jgi:hypothetical protein
VWPAAHPWPPTTVVDDDRAAELAERFLDAAIYVQANR